MGGSRIVEHPSAGSDNVDLIGEDFDGSGRSSASTLRLIYDGMWTMAGENDIDRPGSELRRKSLTAKILRENTWVPATGI